MLADMIEGVVAANQLVPPQSDRLRADLWRACGFATSAEESAGGEAPTVTAA